MAHSIKLWQSANLITEQAFTPSSVVQTTAWTLTDLEFASIDWDLPFQVEVLKDGTRIDAYDTWLSAPEATVSGHGLEEARSGMLSGAAASGEINTWGLTVHVAGVDKTTSVLKRELNIIDNQGKAPSTAAALTRGFTPAAGATFEVYNGGYLVGIPYFRGRITTRTPQARKASGVVRYHVDCVGWMWDLARHRVTAIYRGMGINSVLARVVSESEGGFKVGYAPSSLGNIDQIEFTNKTLVDAIDQLAGRVDGGAYWTCDYNRFISIIPATAQDPFMAGSTISLTDATEDLQHPAVSDNLNETFTRVTVVGGGGSTTAVVSVGASTIPVDETGWYDPAGGTVVANNQVVTYTGRSAGSGAGSLTGCTNIVEDIPQGTPVQPSKTLDDATAQTALAALIGGGGVREYVYANGTLNYQGVSRVASALLAIRKNLFTTFAWVENDDPVRHILAGKLVSSVSLTENLPVSITSGRVQQVTITVKAKVEAGAEPKLYRSITVAPLRQGLLEYLDRLNPEGLQGL